MRESAERSIAVPAVVAATQHFTPRRVIKLSVKRFLNCLLARKMPAPEGKRLPASFSDVTTDATTFVSNWRSTKNVMDAETSTEPIKVSGRRTQHKEKQLLTALRIQTYTDEVPAVRELLRILITTCTRGVCKFMFKKKS